MAVATQTRYCGRCGAPLAPGAGFCGRCGTPVLMQPIAPQPVYSYAPAPPAPAYRAATQPRLGMVVVAGGLVAILVVVGLVVGGIAVSQLARGGGRATCTSNCAPKLITPLPEQASFRSTAYGFTVSYPMRWTVRSTDPNGIELGTKVGQVTVKGVKGQSADEAVRLAVFGLPSSQWQDVSTVTTLKGSHLGEVQGVGGVYSANLVGPSQTATKVRIGVVAATYRDVTVVVFVADPFVKDAPNGIPEGQAVDYLCTEFDWGA